eukprot:1195367-Prorocentrum_minimum.AAC.2
MLSRVDATATTQYRVIYCRRAADGRGPASFSFFRTSRSVSRADAGQGRIRSAQQVVPVPTAARVRARVALWMYHHFVLRVLLCQ